MDDQQGKGELSFCLREPTYFPKESLGVSGQGLPVCVSESVCVYVYKVPQRRSRHMEGASGSIC